MVHYNCGHCGRRENVRRTAPVSSLGGVLMLENRWAREYLKALFESRGQSLQNVPEFLAASGVGRN
jgi:hypothetical protein